MPASEVDRGIMAGDGKGGGGGGWGWGISIRDFSSASRQTHYALTSAFSSSDITSFQ